MMVYAYRGQIGLDPKLELRSFIIHNLAVADHTHQQILKAVPQRLLKSTADIKDIHDFLFVVILFLTLQYIY